MIFSLLVECHIAAQPHFTTGNNVKDTSLINNLIFLKRLTVKVTVQYNILIHQHLTTGEKRRKIATNRQHRRRRQVFLY